MCVCVCVCVSVHPSIQVLIHRTDLCIVQLRNTDAAELIWWYTSSIVLCGNKLLALPKHYLSNNNCRWSSAAPNENAFLQSAVEWLKDVHSDGKSHKLLVGFPAKLWPSGGATELLLNPWHVLGHPGVYTVHPLAAAVLGTTPGHQAKHCPPLADPVLHHKRSPTVAKAGVASALKEPGAEHVVCDVVAAGARCVTCSALLLGHHWQLDILQEVRGDAQIRWKHRRWGGGVDGGDAPARYHAQRVWQGGERGFLQMDRRMEKGSGCVLCSATMDISKMPILGNNLTGDYSPVTTQILQLKVLYGTSWIMLC